MMSTLPGMGLHAFDLGKVVFDRHDTGKNGKLGLEQFKDICLDLGYELSEKEMELALLYLDQDGDGKLNFVEFKLWWNKGNSREKRLHLTDTELESRTNALECFKAFDRSETGSIDSEEFSLFYHHLLRKSVIGRDIEQAELFELLDPNEEGKISYHTYINWLNDIGKMSPRAPSNESFTDLNNCVENAKPILPQSRQQASQDLPVPIQPQSNPTPAKSNGNNYPDNLDEHCVPLIKAKDKVLLQHWKTHQAFLDKLLKQLAVDELEQGKVHDKKINDLERTHQLDEKEQLREFTKKQNQKKKELKKAKLPMSEEEIKKEVDEFLAGIHKVQKIEIEKAKKVNLTQYYDLVSLQIKNRKEADIGGYKEYVAFYDTSLSEQQTGEEAELKHKHDALVKTEGKEIDKLLKATEKQRKKQKDPITREELDSMRASHMKEVTDRNSIEVAALKKKHDEELRTLKSVTDRNISIMSSYYDQKLEVNLVRKKEKMGNE